MRVPREARWLTAWIHRVFADSLWLLPALGTLAGFLLAAAVGTGSGDEAGEWTISVDRSRDTLTAALGLVFTALSIVLALGSVAAQSIASRFGSRTLRIYLRRSVARWVIAMFALTAAFVLSEMFQLRTVDSDAPTPVAALSISIVLMIITGAMLIWYIGAVVRWFRVDEAVASIIASERRALRLATRHRRGTAPVAALPLRPEEASTVMSPQSGYFAEVDHDAILETAGKLDAVVAITQPVGSAVVESQSVGWVIARSGSRPERHVAEGIDVSGTRGAVGSIEYALYALVDIAIIALSPAVNDPNSAVEVIEGMSFLLPEVAREPLGPYAIPDAESRPRVVVAAHTFGELVEVATTQIVLYGMGDPNVERALRRLAASLDLLDLNDDDQRYVNEFAAKLEAPSAG